MSSSVKYEIAPSEEKEIGRIELETKEKLQAEDEQLPTRGNIFQLFKFSGPLSIALMSVGLFFSLTSGASLPVAYYMLGEVMDAFVNQEVLQNSINSQLKNAGVLEQGTNVTYSSNASQASENTSFMDSNYDIKSNTSLTFLEFRERVNFISIICVMIGTFTFLSSFIQILSWEYSSERRVKRLRKLYFSQVIRQDISWFDTYDAGNLSNKLSDDLERMRDGTGYKLSMVLMHFMLVLLNLTISFFINVPLTLISALAIPFMVGLTIYCGKLSTKSAILEQEQYAIAGAVAEETLTNMKTVTAFGGQSKEINRYDKALTQGRKVAMSKYNLIAVLTGVMYSIVYGVPIFIFWYWVEMMQGSKVTPGNVMTIFFYSSETVFNMVLALPFLDCIGGAIGVAFAIKKIILRKAIIDPYSMEGKKLPHLTGQIEFENVYFSYPSRTDSPVLKGLNLKIEPGKTVAIVGSSGAGKSTIVSLILRFYDVLRGQVLVDGIPIPEYNVKWLRSQIGLVSQEPVLFGVSIAENISYGREKVSTEDIVYAAKKANAHDFIVKFPKGYDTMVGDTGSQLSGGQKQRIAIARALIRDPKILLLDEATSALDSVSEGIVQETLEKAMKGRTTVVIAHRLSTIRNADMICVMQDGVLYESGTHNDLMQKRSLYYSLVSDQKSGAVDQRRDKSHGIEGIRNRTSSYELKETRKDTVSSEDSGKLKDQVDEGSEAPFPIKSHYATEERFIESGEHQRDKVTDQNIQKSEKIEESLSVLEFMKLQKPEWPWLLLGFIGCFAVGVDVPISGYLIGELTRVFALSGHALIESSKSWSLTFSILSVFAGFAYYMQTKGITEASKKLIARTRLLVFQNILRQPVGWFEQEASSPGILVSRLARTAPLLEAASGGRAGRVLVSFSNILGGLLIAFICSWKLASLVFVVVPILLCIGYQQQTMQKKHQMRDNKKFEEAGRVASETVRNIRTVKALGQEALFTEIYVKHLELPYKEAQKQAVIFALLYAATQCVLPFMYAMAFKFGAYLLEYGQIQASDVFKVAFSLSFCTYALNAVFSYLQDNTKARTAIRLLNYLLNRKSNIDASSETGLKTVIKGNICFQDVHFSYPTRTDTKVLDGISFTIEEGKTLALVGESGCGKSTIISLLERFYDADSGIIQIDGHDIKDFNVSHLRSHIGLITQEPVLFNLTIKDNIAYGASSHDGNISFDDIQQACRIANIHDFIMSLPNRYDTLAGERGVQLSGGQKQRLAIARALIRKPAILMLDEATSALDTESEKEVQVALNIARQGRTCIIVAHRLSTIQDADKIGVISKGRVMESGTHAELQELKGYYHKLIQKQCV